MERIRKRASNGRSLRASNNLKKSKPGETSLTGFSASSGGMSPDKDPLCKTEYEAITIGEYGRTAEPTLKPSWRDENCSDMEGSIVVGSETLEHDKAIVFKKEDDDLQEDLVQPDFLTMRNHPPREDTPEKSKSTKQQTKSYICECGKSYTSTSHLNRHQKSHGRDTKRSSGQHVGEPCEVKATNETSFPCICGKTYTISSDLYRHHKTCRAGTMTNFESDADESRSKPYSCVCGKSYTSSSHLYRHQRSHLEENKQSVKTHICHCGKMFISKSNLTRHQKLHTQETFKIEEHRSDSVEDTETEAPGRKKTYACECGKSYTSSSHLYRHQRTHQAEKVCASPSFRAEKNNLEKPYKCECGKSYTCTSHLYRHQRTHQTQELLVDDVDCDSDVHMDDPDEKPYQCECGKSFILWFSLMVHKRIHCKAKLQSSSVPDSS